MTDLSKVGHKRLWDHVLQWFIRNIWEKDERHRGPMENDLITFIRLEFLEVYEQKLCDRHHIFLNLLTRALINLSLKTLRIIN